MPRPSINQLKKEINKLCPESCTESPLKKKSWELFIRKLYAAQKAKTLLICITANDDIIANRDILQEKYPCQIITPTEARFGYDSITTA